MYVPFLKHLKVVDKMDDLIREINPHDVKRIHELVEEHLPSAGACESIVRLGGLTNRSYFAMLANGSEYLVRMPGEGTEDIINRQDERKSTQLACKLGIDTELFYFGDDGVKIMGFVSSPQHMSKAVMRKKENLLKAVDIFKKLHTCGENTGVAFEIFDMAKAYEAIIAEYNVALPDGYEDNKRIVMDIKAYMESEQGVMPRVPCHNDALPENWVLAPDGMLYLIDWEYAGMNEFIWDLSCLSIESDYTEKHDREMLRAYHGHEPTAHEYRYFIAGKVYVEYLWSMWGLTRIPYEGDFMQRYADNRYTRLKRFIKEYKELG